MSAACCQKRKTNQVSSITKLSLPLPTLHSCLLCAFALVARSRGLRSRHDFQQFMATDGTRPDVDPASTATAGGADVMAAGWRACWSSSGFDGRRLRPSSRVHCTGASIRPDDYSGARRSSVGPGADGSAGTERADPQYTPTSGFDHRVCGDGCDDCGKPPFGQYITDCHAKYTCNGHVLCREACHDR